MADAPAELAAMRRALTLAATPGVPLGPNPRVGAVLLRADGSVIAEGFHRGAGTPHAEADALARAGAAAAGSTAVVTLEPCNHSGRTGPCSEALIRAGVTRVVYAIRDPHLEASGGGAALAAAGIQVESGLLADEATAVNRAWLFGLGHLRPLVTWKVAVTLDGRVAAADGTSRWISSTAARRDAHRLRATCDTVLASTGTVAADDPALTVRDDEGRLLPVQPLRAVMGRRELPAGARVLDDSAETLLLRTHEPAAALGVLFDRGRRHVLLEGGPTLAAAFLTTGLVDEIVAYVAPVLLGAGPAAVADLGITTIDRAKRLRVADIRVLAAGDGEDPDNQPNVRLTLRPR